MEKKFDILRRPIVTEKATALKESDRQIVLEAAHWANKHEIKAAAKNLFDVDVLKVRTSIVRGKVKRIGSTMGKRKNWKKAVLTLSEDADMDVFGVVAPPVSPAEAGE